MRTYLVILPNVLSAARLVLGLVFPWLPFEWRLVSVVFAAFSDYADEAISRQFRVSSDTGRLLDAVADKVFVFVVILTLLLEGSCEWWEVVFVGLRDIAVLGGGAWLLLQRDWSAFRRMNPTIWGKVTTTLQFIFLAMLLLWEPGAVALLVPTVLVGVWATFDYFRIFFVQRQQDEQGDATQEGSNP